MDKAAADALDQDLVGHLELQDGINLADALGDEHLVERDRLRGRAREPVEDEPILALGRLDVVLDDTNHQVVGHQAARLHDRLGLLAQLRTRKERAGKILHTLGTPTRPTDRASRGMLRRAEQLRTHLCAGRDRSTQQVASGEVAELVLVLDDRGLPNGQMARGGSSMDDTGFEPRPAPGGSSDGSNS